MERNDVDIAPELLKTLQDDFNQRIAGNKKLAEIYEKVNSGTATYREANEFALQVGNTLAEVFRDNVSADVLPDGRMYYNIADRVIRPMMIADHTLISSTCFQVQTRLDQMAHIGIMAQEAELNEDKVNGIINKVSAAERYEDVAWVLDEPIKTFSQSIVDDSIRVNVDFQGKSGLYPKIVRTSAGGCCEWCEEVAGTYRYPDVPKDVYRRHAHCRCMVDYDPADGKGQRQNVHDKTWHNYSDGDALEHRKTVGLDASDQKAQIEYRKNVGLMAEQLSGTEREVRANWRLGVSKGTGDHLDSKKEELGYVDPENVDRTIKYFADQIRHENIEHAIIIQKDGKVIHFTGDESGVWGIDSDLDGAHVLHNHPSSNGILSFGEDDFIMIRGNQSAIYDLCNEEYDYHVEVIKDMSDLHYNGVYWWPRDEKIASGDDYQHLVMEALAERGYIRYERVKRS